MREIANRASAEYLAAAVDGDLSRAQAAVRLALAQGLEPAAVHREVVAPAMEAVGELWERGELGVADEHLATAVTQAVLARLDDATERATPPGGSAFVVCAEGEQHHVGARMIADRLSWAGWRVLFLGPSVPTGELVRLAAERRPDVVAISCVMPARWPAVKRAATQLGALPAGPRVVVGGRAVESLPAANALGPGVVVVDPDEDGAAVIEELLHGGSARA